MRLFYFQILLFTGFLGHAQSDASIDDKVMNYPEFTSINTLSIRIQNDFEIDSERVRAAFVWITGQMDYTTSLNQVFRPKRSYIYHSEFGKKYRMP